MENETPVPVGHLGVPDSTGRTYEATEPATPEATYRERMPVSRATGHATIDVEDSSAPERPIPLRELTAQHVADRLIDLCYEHGDVLSNLKLQKLLYYAQAWYLALHNRPMFRERIEAWIHGPSQPDVFAHYKRFGSGVIDRPASGVTLTAKGEQHLRDVLEAYGSFSAFDLERLTQEERPWQEARNGIAMDEPSTAVISTAAMKRYYKARLDEQKKAKKTTG